ncbi:hypothetical protein CMO88_04645 [Candidatus Woesearchaeota archaeon]|nr:hypothetical protein [Candidatus Woesearchaeota archaeon]|tara:strand:- start:14013 stop:14546 length:534 start_codon:yes stop_codon:yes gene_type:complete
MTLSHSPDTELLEQVPTKSTAFLRSQRVNPSRAAEYMVTAAYVGPFYDSWFIRASYPPSVSGIISARGERELFLDVWQTSIEAVVSVVQLADINNITAFLLNAVAKHYNPNDDFQRSTPSYLTNDKGVPYARFTAHFASDVMEDEQEARQKSHELRVAVFEQLDSLEGFLTLLTQHR